MPAEAAARVWNRIERRRFGSGRGWPMFVAGASCAVAASVLCLWWARAPRPMARATEPRAALAEAALPEQPELVAVDLPRTARVVVGPHSRGAVEPDGVTLRLDRGSVLLHVQPRPPEAPFRVRTPSCTVRVVGTVLRVSVSAAGDTTVAVGHGAVEVTPLGGAPVAVRAGERWPAGATEEPSERELDALGAADREGTTLDSFGSRLRSESALYQAGWNAFHRAGDPARAVDIWSEELQRFPTGLLTEEARTSTIDALVALREPARARAQINRYLRDRPRGARAAEMHFVRGTLSLALDGDCRRAGGDFAVALRQGPGPWTARARELQARCARWDR
jgi:hypothetical protein